MLKPLTEEFQLDVRLLAEGIKTLGVPLRRQDFVRQFILAKLDTVYNSIALATTIKDGRAAHNIHRDTASMCHVTHLLRLLPPTDVGELWSDFDNRQSK